GGSESRKTRIEEVRHEWYSGGTSETESIVVDLRPRRTRRSAQSFRDHHGTGPVGHGSLSSGGGGAIAGGRAPDSRAPGRTIAHAAVPARGRRQPVFGRGAYRSAGPAVSTLAALRPLWPAGRVRFRV